MAEVLQRAKSLEARSAVREIANVEDSQVVAAIVRHGRIVASRERAAVDVAV
jgi:hypothetical protein